MIEFGEQLRRAREEKGMTQQSLAEQLYVTRQAVSRWECGDRFPDLLTTKKLSVILDVSLDELLSGNEMNKAIERNPIIEHPTINKIMIGLFGFLSIYFIVVVIELIKRFPFVSQYVDYSDILVILFNITGLITQIVIFTYGIIAASKGILSPKRMGGIITIFFVSICFADSYGVFRNVTRQLAFLALFMIIPSLVGAVSAFMFFCKASAVKIWVVLIVISSSWAIVRMIINTYNIICYTGQFVSMNTALGILLKTCFYLLIIFIASQLEKKRKHAVAI